MQKTDSIKSLRLYSLLVVSIFGLSAYSLLSAGQYDILFAFYALPLITFLFFAFHFTGRGMKLAEIHAREEMALTETSAYEFLAPHVLRLFALYFVASAFVVTLITSFVGIYEYVHMDADAPRSSFNYYAFNSQNPRFYTFSTSLVIHHALAFVSGWIILLAACLRIFRGLCRRANLGLSQNILPYFQASLAALVAYFLPWITGFTLLRLLPTRIDSGIVPTVAPILFQILTLACYFLASRAWSGTCRDYFRFENA